MLFYSRAGEISDYNNCLLQRSDGIYSYVWHYERRVISGCARLVRIFITYLSTVILFKLSCLLLQRCVSSTATTKNPNLWTWLSKYISCFDFVCRFISLSSCFFFASSAQIKQQRGRREVWKEQLQNTRPLYLHLYKRVHLISI